MDHCAATTTNHNNKKQKRIHYDKITVWPSNMFEDLMSKWKNENQQPHQPPKPLPRTASLHDKLFRARSMAPNHIEIHRSNTTAGGWYDRATSAPPAPPPIFRRYLLRIFNFNTEVVCFLFNYRKLFNRRLSRIED